MNIYKLTFIDEDGFKSHTGVKAKNKVEAITKGLERLKGWREKDRIIEIKIEEDRGNRELTAEDYK